MVAELALRRQALLELELQLQAEELQPAGREQTDVGPPADCGPLAEAELCAAGFLLERQGSLRSAPAADPEPDRDAHEVAGWRPGRRGCGTRVR